MALRVFKFGGTCIGDSRGRAVAAAHCRKAVEAGDRLVVVVSAMGRSGDPYATDTLLELAGSCPPAERDLVLCCGEVISAVVMAETLRQAGVPSEALAGWDAGIVTDGHPSAPDIECVQTDPIRDTLSRGACAVVAGFQGRARDGRITTLGRGGSDTTAMALGAALGADEVVLFKNVEAIFTADPALVPSAARIERISAEDLRQMSWQGAKVVHPRAAELAIESRTPIEVRSHDTGALVTRVEPFVIRSGRYISGVAAGSPVWQFSVDGTGRVPREFHASVFGMVAAEGISMDMFTVFGASAVFTVPVEEAERVRGILSAGGLKWSETGPCVKVSIVGAGCTDSGA